MALTVSLCCSAARQSAGGQTVAEGGRWVDQGGFWLLEPQEENLQGRLPHPQCQAGEEGWLKHQRPLCGLPPTDGEDADKEGRDLCQMEEVVLLYLLHANHGFLDDSRNPTLCVMLIGFVCVTPHLHIIGQTWEYKWTSIVLFCSIISLESKF